MKDGATGRRRDQRGGLCDILAGGEGSAETCLLRKLVELAPRPMLALDRSLQAVAANSAAMKLLEKETTCLPLSAKALFDAKALGRLESFFSGGSKTSVACFRAELATSERKEICVKAHPLTGDGGEVIGIALCLSHALGGADSGDISHSKKIEALGLYAAGVIHEFNNILAVIAGRAGIGLLAEGAAAKEHALQNVIKAAQRAEHVVKDLLMYVEKRRPEFVLADLSSVVLEAISLLSMELASGYIEVSHDLADIPPVMCDPVQISQVCFNLIHNAMEAMPEGGSVEITLRKRGGWAVISVSDTGVGVPPEMRSRIFEPFVSHGKSRSGKSSCAGLGLFVVREIVLCHGGEISLESAVAKGSTFTVRIPITPEDRQAGVVSGDMASVESSTAVS